MSPPLRSRLSVWVMLATGALWLARGAPALGADVPPAAVATSEASAGAVINRWRLAIEGEKPGAAVTSVVRRGNWRTQADAAPVDVLVQARADRSYRFEYAMPSYGTLIQAYDGGIAWQFNEALGFGYIPSDEHEFSLSLTDWTEAEKATARHERLIRLPDEFVDGLRREVVEVVTPREAREKWYFDPASGQRVRVEQRAGGRRRILEFSDFRETEGVIRREPFRLVRSEGGRRQEIVYTSVRYNAAIAAEIFAPPRDLTAIHREIDRLLLLHAQASGRDAVATLTTRVTEQEIEITTSGVTVATTIYQKQPNLILSEQESPGLGKMWRGYDGETGWAWNEVEGFREIQGAELQQLIATAALEGPMHMTAEAPLRRIAGKREVDGRTLLGVMLSSREGVAGLFFFDAETYQLAAVETLVQAGPSGQMRIKAGFSDYRKVDGVAIAHRSTLTHPAMAMVITVKSVKHNVPLDDALFAPRRE